MPYKILVVDDQVENLKIMVNYLQSHKCQYDLLQSNAAGKALAIAVQTKPDLIITDWDMPGMDGLAFIKALKLEPSTRDIPVVMATGVMLSSQNLMLALDAGAFDYLRKPIDPIELQARVNSALTISEYHRKAIDAKNHELAEFALLMVKQNKFNQGIRDQLTELLNTDANCERSKLLLAQTIGQIDEQLRVSEYEKFDVVFTQVHPSFNKNLLDRFADLTAGELRLCAYVRMGLSIKDVAALMCISPESVKVARSRLRKKLGLEGADNLESFLMGM
jgi:DNA-binding response OmpR family regulator/DNA-binding CsgD family transcriptional regulator